MSEPKTYWAGFSDGKIAIVKVDDGFGGFGIAERRIPAIFLSRSLARTEFKDVRKVKIVEIK